MAHTPDFSWSLVVARFPHATRCDGSVIEDHLGLGTETENAKTPRACYRTVGLSPPFTHSPYIYAPVFRSPTTYASTIVHFGFHLNRAKRLSSGILDEMDNKEINESKPAGHKQDEQDRTIIGTAVPTISKHFNSFGDIAWYEAGFLLPLCMLQLSFGRVYKYYSTKWLLVALVAIFEIGSIVCATAPSSNALIVGRVVQGIGGTGITAGAFMLINLLVPLQSRPKYAGGLGSVFGLASIIGPIAGGYLTSITWRWCFWINVPVGGLSLILLLLAPQTAPPVPPASTWRGKLTQLDPLGFMLIGPAIICLLFAVQWGGTKYAWSDGRIIALFVIFGVLGLTFVASQAWRGDAATIPPKIFFRRSVLCGCIAMFGIGSALVLYSFYLPIWFQVIQGKSPSSSGLSLLPLLLSNVFSVIGGGIATSVLGYYTPFMILGSAVLVVGSALITTWQASAGPGLWIGFQIITGFGLGLVLQQPNIAVQTVLPDSEVSIGFSLLNFISFLGGNVMVSVSQNLLEMRLIRGLQKVIPDLDPSVLANGGATSLRSMVSGDKLPVLLDVYDDAIRAIWYVALAMACLILLASLGMEWRSTLGLTTSLMLAGINIGSSALTIPILHTRPASVTTPIFHEFYLRGAALNVPLAILSAACSATVAYVLPAQRQLWVTAAVATISQLPWTLLVMMGTNQRLIAIAQSHVEQEKVGKDEVEGLLKRWGWMNYVRGGLALVGGGVGVWALLEQ
ncbi:MAG: hypothetical protein Q9202_003781 [Teloschistes flavicans]